MAKQNQTDEAANEAKAKRARNVFVTFSDESHDRSIKVPNSMTVKTGDGQEATIDLTTAPDGTFAFGVSHGLRQRAGDSFASVSKEVADGGDKAAIFARILGEVVADISNGDFTIKRGGGGGLTRQAYAVTYISNAYANKGQVLTQKQAKEIAVKFLALPEEDARIVAFNAAFEAAKNAGNGVEIDL